MTRCESEPDHDDDNTDLHWLLRYYLASHTHFTHDLSPVEHDFVPFAKAVFWCLLSF